MACVSSSKSNNNKPASEKFPVEVKYDIKSMFIVTTAAQKKEMHTFSKSSSILKLQTG